MKIVQASAHGRVNLIGEHTDYNGGFVLPTLIPQRTTVTLERRAGDRVEVSSHEVGQPASYQLGAEARRGDWLDYVQGCTAALRSLGHPLGGMTLTITSDVPLGSGLSSSAALEIALLRALRAAFELSIDDVVLAQLGQRAEHELVGAPVGIMDQLVVSVGAVGEALAIDIRALTWRSLPMPRGLDVVVIASGIHHTHASGGYRVRRAECEAAARELGVVELRDVALDDLQRLASLPPPLDRRARHVVTENARVEDAIRALEGGDLRALGAILLAGHASLRDDFEVSLPAIDLLVELAAAMPQVFGVRLTGGGFGGSIVALVTGGQGAAVAADVAERYRASTGHQPTVLVAQELSCGPS